MKKTLSFLTIIFVLIFAVSCGSSKKDNTDSTDTDSTDTDSTDTDSTDTDSTDTDSTDTDSTDTDSTDTDSTDTDSTDTDSTDTDSTDTDSTDTDEGDTDEGDTDEGDTDPADTGDTTEIPDLIGKFTDNYGGIHFISTITWFQPSAYGDSLFHITQYDNENDFIIAQNDTVMSWNPDKWSRFDYTEKDGKIYYCQTVYDAETEGDALAAEAADKTDPATSGCGGFSWSELAKIVETGIDKDDEKIVAWATGYENYIVGENVDDEWKTPEKALGKAIGDSYDVVVLGDKGSITLTFAKPITDGEGADFAVFENSFNDSFLELGTVEVSSDGVNFVAFDHYYLGVEEVDSYGGHDQGLIWGFAGKFKQGVGTMFDLAELAGKAEVANGTLDLEAVTHVKIVDVIGDGSQLDSLGNPIYDPYPTAGSAGFDLDAVAVINEKE